MILKTLTPVHVGSGDIYTPIEFAVKNGEVYILDSERVLEQVDKKGHDLMKISKEIGMGGNIEDYVDVIGDFTIFSAPLVGELKRREISRNISSGGRLYIPGSSIKGAIRTALLWQAVKNDRNLLNYSISLMEGAVKNNKRISVKILRSLDDRLEARVFRKKKDDPKYDLMKGIVVRDSGFFDTRKFYEVKVLGTNLSAVVECIDCENKTEVEIKVDELKINSVDGKLDFDQIIDACRNFSKEVVNVELNYKYSDVTKKEFKKVLNANGMILRIGWGTGWYSTTIGTLLVKHEKFNDLRKKLKLGRKPGTGMVSRRFPATRRITADGKPLGWIEIR
jgi:CRISPR-associated protein Csm5